MRNDTLLLGRRNIGPTIASRLREVGIETVGDLRRVGPLKVYKRLVARHPDVTFPVCYYLYSLQGALDDVHWDALAPGVKQQLLRDAGYVQPERQVTANRAIRRTVARAGCLFEGRQVDREKAMNASEVTDRHQLHGAQVVLMVEDVRKTVDFYCDVLGFHLDFDWGDPPTHARVSSGDREHASAARIRFEKADPSLLTRKTCYIYMHIGAGMDELFETFRSRGVEIVEEPNDRPWGRQFGIRDLNGYVLSFLTSR